MHNHVIMESLGNGSHLLWIPAAGCWH